MASKLVAEKYAVSRAWVDRLKPRRRETGEIAPRRQTRWRTPRLPAQLPRLAILIREQPDRTLVEWQQALPTSASLPTIWRGGHEARLPPEKKRCTRPNTPGWTMAEARAAWQQTGPTWDPARLVFLDESGGRTDLVRRYGRGQRGERVVDHAPDRCWHTTTLLAALRVTGLTAPAVFDGPNQGHAQCFGGRDDRNRARHRRGATGWGEERLGSSVTRLERVAGWLSDVFGIDTRSLAVFRIGLALTILLDLVLRRAGSRSPLHGCGRAPAGAARG